MAIGPSRGIGIAHVINRTVDKRAAAVSMRECQPTSQLGTQCPSSSSPVPRGASAARSSPQPSPPVTRWSPGSGTSTPRRPHRRQRADVGQRPALVRSPSTSPTPDAARAAVRTAVGRFGRLEVLVNNAGYANLASIEDVDPADFRAQVETNPVRRGDPQPGGRARHARAGLRAHRAGLVRRWPHVDAGLGAYQTAKWAVGGFSSVLARRRSGPRHRVTVLEPGGMRPTGPARP